MTGDIEAVGDIATGAALAVAAERPFGSESKAKVCLNCGAALTGNFCSTCGQRGEVHRTLTAFWHDLLHSILHFDGKIWQTLPLLFFKPGELTRRYIHGERAKFISPLALFLFSIFLMFAAFNAFAPKLDEAQFDKIETGISLAGQRDGAQKRLAALEKQVASGHPAPGIEGQIAGEKAAIAQLDAAMKRLSEDKSTSMAAKGPVEIDMGPGGSGLSWLDKAAKQAVKNPQLLLYKAQSNAYKFSWALIILSVPFVWLMFFWRREFKLYDHAVFVTYSLCFAAILLTLAGLVDLSTGFVASASQLAVLWIPVHMYLQLRGAYHIGRRSALVRAGYLSLAAMLVVSMFVVLMLVNGMLG